MTEDQAAELVRDIVKLLEDQGQWYCISYEFRGDKLYKINFNDISIKIKNEYTFLYQRTRIAP